MDPAGHAAWLAAEQVNKQNGLVPTVKWVSFSEEQGELPNIADHGAGLLSPQGDR